MAKNLRQRLNERSASIAQANEDQRLVQSWMQNIKFQDSQARGAKALASRKAAKLAGRAKARDIYLKDQA